MALNGFTQKSGEEALQTYTVGFQVRPVFASKFLDAGEISATDRIFTTRLKPSPGYTFGMIIRRSFTKKMSLETGINYFRRNYLMTCVEDSLKYTDISDFGMVTYEIPVQFLVYVRLGKSIYMNNSFGVSFNWFASDVATLGKNKSISQYTGLNRTIGNLALLANIGFEWRTEKAGYFYFGGSLHRPFNSIATSYILYDAGPNKYRNTIQLSGSFLTADFRYFFKAHPIQKKKKTSPQKKNK